MLRSCTCKPHVFPVDSEDKYNVPMQYNRQLAGCITSHQHTHTHTHTWHSPTQHPIAWLWHTTIKMPLTPVKIPIMHNQKLWLVLLWLNRWYQKPNGTVPFLLFKMYYTVELLLHRHWVSIIGNYWRLSSILLAGMATHTWSITFKSFLCHVCHLLMNSTMSNSACQ